ncbi:hypothetical protein ABZO31_17780 [Streptomyces sp. HUAS MG47]|uniref:hypothetical protein n=1 Tax=Streptomyces solicamelliae TaxID=3231716 RepID=UPI00387799E4
MGETRRRGRKWLWISLTLIAAVVGLPVGAVAWGAYQLDQAGEPKPVDCAEAMDWAGATLPRSAGDPRCTGTHWLDVNIRSEFRMPRDEVPGWLAGTWPAGVPKTEYCLDDAAALCMHLEDEALAADPLSGPAAVDVSVRYEDGETALVTVSAFTV